MGTFHQLIGCFIKFPSCRPTPHNVYSHLEPLTLTVQNLYPDCHAVCRTNAGHSSHRRSRGLCARLRRHDYTRAGHAVLQFDALRLARSSRSGLLQEHAVRSSCSWPTIVRAGRVIVTRCARISAGISSVRNLCLLLSPDCGGISRSSIPRLTSTHAFTHLVSPPVGSPASLISRLCEILIVLGEKCEISVSLRLRTIRSVLIHRPHIGVDS